MSKCIFCRKCERSCPTNAITTNKEAKTQTVVRNRCHRLQHLCGGMPHPDHHHGRGVLQAGHRAGGPRVLGGPSEARVSGGAPAPLAAAGKSLQSETAFERVIFGAFQ